MALLHPEHVSFSSKPCKVVKSWLELLMSQVHQFDFESVLGHMLRQLAARNVHQRVLVILK